MDLASTGSSIGKQVVEDAFIVSSIKEKKLEDSNKVNEIKEDKDSKSIEELTIDDFIDDFKL